MPKIRGYVKTFQNKYGNNNKNDKLMSSLIDNNKLVEAYKSICTKIEDLKHIELDALPVFYIIIKNKITEYGDKFYTIFC